MFLFSTIIELWTATDGEGRSTEALDESDVLQLYMINPLLAPREAFTAVRRVPSFGSQQRKTRLFFRIWMNLVRKGGSSLRPVYLPAGTMFSLCQAFSQLCINANRKCSLVHRLRARILIDR